MVENAIIFPCFLNKIQHTRCKSKYLEKEFYHQANPAALNDITFLTHHIRLQGACGPDAPKERCDVIPQKVCYSLEETSCKTFCPAILHLSHVSIETKFEIWSDSCVEIWRSTNATWPYSFYLIFITIIFHFASAVKKIEPFYHQFRNVYASLKSFCIKIVWYVVHLTPQCCFGDLPFSLSGSMYGVLLILLMPNLVYIFLTISLTISCVPWWRHQMEIFSTLLTICAGNSPVTGEFPSQRPVTRRFDVFFDPRLNRRLSKQSWGWWFETPSCSLWRHCSADICCYIPYCSDKETRLHQVCFVEISYECYIYQLLVMPAKIPFHARMIFLLTSHERSKNKSQINTFLQLLNAIFRYVNIS